MTVDIVCSVLNGAQYLGAFFKSLQEQTHTEWRIWIREDGSTDKSAAIIGAAVIADTRITLLHAGGPPLGVAGAYGWLLEHIPPNCAYVMIADADDVWMPHKIERTLAAMRAAESEKSGPILVHTDLTVVDHALNPLHDSLWRSARFDVARSAFRELIVRNVVTAPSVMLNRALRELIGATPPEPKYQDWWYALVASAFGRIVAVNEPTVLYRRHGANAVLGRRRSLRADLAHEAAQARAFLYRYGSKLKDDDRAFLTEYARIPELSFFERKRAVMRLRHRPEDGWLRNLGVVLRA